MINTLMCVFAIVFAMNNVSQFEIEELYFINDTLNALIQYKDTERVIELKYEHLKHINKFRRSKGLKELKLDILASRAANMHSYECAVNGYFGHINERGELPFMRYAFAGGNDHILENLYLETLKYFKQGKLNEDDKKEFKTNIKDTLQYMKKGFDEFVKEGKGGGHYEAIVKPYHNYVGLGYYEHIFTKGDTIGLRMIYAEKYVDRYIDFKKIKKNVKVNEKFKLAGRMIDDKMNISALIVYYFPFTQKKSFAQINASRTYNDYSDELVFSYWPWDLKKYIDGNEFDIEVSFNKKGLYYIQFYVDYFDMIPYEHGSYNTSDGIPASGIIVEVR